MQSEYRKMLFELPKELVGLAMLGEIFQSFLNYYIGGLQIASFFRQMGGVEGRLEHVRTQLGGGGKEGSGSLDVTASHLQDAEVVEGLVM